MQRHAGLVVVVALAGFGCELDGRSPPAVRMPAIHGGTRAPDAPPLTREPQSASPAEAQLPLGELVLEVMTVLPPEEERVLRGGLEETLAGVGSLRASVHRVEAVLESALLPDAFRFVASDDEHLLTLLDGLDEPGPRFLLRVPVPAGALSQVRLITDDVALELRGDVVKVAVPSGAETGLKVVPDGGEAFIVRADAETRLRVLFDPYQSLTFNHAGMRMHPVLRAVVVPAPDKDGDGAAGDDDCNDDDARVHPGAQEVCGNEIDDDCDGADSDCPEPPALVPPPVDATVPTTVHHSSFLFEGDAPVQRGVAPGTIEIHRMSVVHGEVTDAEGTPLGGVEVSVADHPEYGTTLARGGAYHVAVNGTGAGPLTLSFRRQGMLATERSVVVPWLREVHVEPVVLVAEAAFTARADLSGASPVMQAVAGPSTTDEPGPRRPVLLFPAGVSASATLDDGTTVALDGVAVRMTERSVGPRGASAVAGSMPPNAGYLYALDITLDEAAGMGARSVELAAPARLYVDGFVSLPVGTQLWLGSYSDAAHSWRAERNGIVVALAGVDVTGSAVLTLSEGGAPATAAELTELGVTPDELRALATLYQPGDVLWRALLPHLSSLSFSLPLLPPVGAAVPATEPPSSDPTCDDPTATSCSDDGVVMHRSVALPGLPLSLHYSSGRTRGRSAAFDATISTSIAFGSVVPNAISAAIDVAGQRISISAEPGVESISTRWDGLNAYGQSVQGEQQLAALVRYEHDGVYHHIPAGSSFGAIGAGEAIAGVDARAPALVEQRHEPRRRLGVLDAELAYGLGGLGIDVDAVYDGAARVVYRGDGSRVTASGFRLGRQIGNGDTEPRVDGPADEVGLRSPTGVVAAPDGSVYVSERFGRIVKVTRDHQLVRVAGTDVPGFNGDGPGLESQLDYVVGLALASDGSLIISDSGNHRVRRLGIDGMLETIAGTGTPGFSGDGGDAREAELNFPTGVAVSKDGWIFVGDGAVVVRAISPDGIISTVAGTPGIFGFGPDEVQATQSALSFVFDVDADSQGRLYITEYENHRVRRVDRDGVIRTVAGFLSPTLGDFLVANIAFPRGVAPRDDGSFFLTTGLILDEGVTMNRVLYIEADGGVRGIGGYDSGGEFVLSDELPVDPGGLSTAAVGDEYGPQLLGIALAPDDGLFVVNARFPGVVHSVVPLLPGPSAAGALVPLPSGDQLAFDVDGSAVAVLDPAGGERYSFVRKDGRLTTLLDAFGGTALDVERLPDGTGQRISSPFLGALDAFDLVIRPDFTGVIQGNCPRILMGFRQQRLVERLETVRGDVAVAFYDPRGRPNPVEIESARAYPPVIRPGEVAVLELSAINSTKCLTRNGSTTTSAECIDVVQVAPLVTTTYDVTAAGVGGVLTGQITVEVLPWP